MTTPDERWVKVVGLVLPRDDEGRVLLARHTYGPPVWAFVGGMAEPGEAPDQTARREALEETGYVVTTDRLISVCDLDDLLLFIFEGRVISGELANQVDEIAELRWFTPTQLADVPLYEVARHLLDGRLTDLRAGMVTIEQPWQDGPALPAYLVPPRQQID